MLWLFVRTLAVYGKNDFGRLFLWYEYKYVYLHAI